MWWRWGVLKKGQLNLVSSAGKNVRIASTNYNGLHAWYSLWLLVGICFHFRHFHGYLKEIRKTVHSTSAHPATFLEVSGSISNETSHSHYGQLFVLSKQWVLLGKDFLAHPNSHKGLPHRGTALPFWKPCRKICEPCHHKTHLILN